MLRHLSSSLLLTGLTGLAAALPTLVAPPPARAQASAPAAACAPAPTAPPTRTALVLSGGGAKGLAHIGVLRVLDSLGIRPDLVVGTSMGAIVGAMYASGYSGAEIDSLARKLPIATFFRSYEPRAPQALGALRPLVVWAQGERGFALQSAAVRETEVNALVNAAMLRGNLLARGDFDRLPIPFRAVAADLTDRRAIVLAHGDLARAVRASFAIPLIFSPERIDGRALVDGGLAANIPVAAARAAGATRVIVSDATERPRDTLDLDNPIHVADRLLGFLFEQPADSLRPGDVRIRPAVDGFRSLDFSDANIKRLVAAGVRAADTTLVGAACAAPALAGGTDGADRAAAGDRAPGRPGGLTVDTVALAAASAAEQRALARTLGLEPGAPLDPVRVRQRLRRIGESETYRAVWLRPTGEDHRVRFDLAVERAPRRVAGLGLAYDNELGGRMWLGIVDRALLGTGAEGSALLELGELRRELGVGLRYNRGAGRRFVTPTLTGRIATEAVRQFALDGEELTALDTREAVGFAGLERSFVHGWLVAGGLEARTWRNDDGTKEHAAGTVARLGHLDRGNQQRLLGELLWTNIYHRATLDAAPPVRLGALTLLPRVRLGWGERLPAQLDLAFGGDDGFPGLHIGERRGDREVLGALGLAVPLRSPLVAHLEVATGRDTVGGPLFAGNGWLVGARVGLGADTPIGPVRVEYGRNSDDRDALYVRLGRWF